MNNLEKLTKQNQEKLLSIIKSKQSKEKIDNEITKLADDIFPGMETYKKVIDRISELEIRSNSIPTTRNPPVRSQNHEDFPALASRQPTSHQEAQATRGYRKTYANQAKETGVKPKIAGRYGKINNKKPKQRQSSC